MKISEHWLRRQLAGCLVMFLALPLGETAVAAMQPALPRQQAAQNQQSAPTPPAPNPQQSGTSNPVGTAAAPYQKTTGVAASSPAGAVIAPAKQRRAHSFLIKAGLILGAAIAVGTVVALSNASPSRPH